MTGEKPTYSMLKHLKEVTQLMPIYTPYTYFIEWSSLNVKYYGVRFAKTTNCLYESGCHPDDFWVTYFTSSKLVKDFIRKNGDPDIVRIDKTFKSSEEARDYEHSILTFLDVKHNSCWLNKSSGKCLETSGPKSEETKLKISRKQKGVKRGSPTVEHRNKISKSLRGRKVTRTEEHQAKLAATRRGPKTELHKERISQAMKNKLKPIVLCPYCNALTSPVALSRFHSEQRCPGAPNR